ncbi:uncharacterized protein LOC129305507 [Prosopis cineraria]|uniref:uncharacterized protein LOC129305507 n=1 Tax=Prosopis cineraria TaxID=364024 RepID=UPI002410552E|nr:uncharacterized protein LOC129305507 [Prosopis cineraria]
MAEQRATIPGRVFAVMKEEARASSNLIKSIISIYGNRIEALFDSRATHSFISKECVDRLKLELKELPIIIKVTTPSGLSSNTSRACQRVEIVFEDRVSVIDLICIFIKGIDVIVGTDWLTANNATLNYARKLVSLPMSLTRTTSTEQLRFLSVVQAKKLINQGYNAYIVVCTASSVYDNGI